MLLPTPAKPLNHPAMAQCKFWILKGVNKKKSLEKMHNENIYRSKAGAWDCDTCLTDVIAVSAVWNSAEAAQGIADGLSGPGFCESPDLGLDEEQLAVCKNYVQTAGPLGFQFIFRAVAQYNLEFYTELYGVCQDHKLF